MTEGLSPKRWAIDISQVLNKVLGAEHFPINVEQVAKEFSRQRFPDDPITLVAGEVLPRFDGALVRAPSGKKGWGIIYNKAIQSPGRVNFTLAHEFGHYLLHRLIYPNGPQCGEQDVVRWDSEYGQIEYQANVFASYLLMPLDDVRRQIDPRIEADLEKLGACAKRYNVSLIAATLKWLEYTERRAVIVVSRDGFILWARSSTTALKTGAFFRTSGDPIPIPTGSLAAQGTGLDSIKAGLEFQPGTWFKEEPCREMAVFSEQYEFTISLLLLPKDAATSRFNQNREEDEEEQDDLLDRIKKNHGLS
ncbi:MAG: ImmA/IrrE family metallo-endopeptidase [Pseudomonadota bacterium]